MHKSYMFRTYYVTERMHIQRSVLRCKRIRPPPAHPFQVIFTMSKNLKVPLHFRGHLVGPVRVAEAGL